MKGTEKKKKKRVMKRLIRHREKRGIIVGHLTNQET